MNALQILARSILFLRKCGYHGMSFILKNAFSRHGKNTLLDPGGLYTYQNIQVGDNVSLGYGAVLLAADSRIIIGNHVMFGPYVTCVGGDHNTSVSGQPMFAVTNKRPEDDQDIIIEDDVWVCAGAIILKGVTIGRGSIIGAGAVVRTDVLPYTIVCGVPAHKVGTRFPDKYSLMDHESALYEPQNRLPEKIIEQIFADEPEYARQPVH